MARDYLTGDRDQAFLLPPDMREWLPAGHLVWFILDVVERLDLSGFERVREDPRGRRSYDPAVLVSVLVYAYCVGERSSRRIEQRCVEDVAFRVAAANLAPDHTTLSRFVKDHGDAFEALFVQVLALAGAAGLGQVGAIYVDGTKVGADTSPLAGRTRDQLEAEVARITGEARERDTEEDDRFGDGRGDVLPAELVDPNSRRARLDAALDEIVDVEARRARQGNSAHTKRPPRVSVTDPQARTMKSPRGFLFAYNAQAVVSEDRLVLAADVTQDPVDNTQFVPMVDAALENLEAAGMGAPEHAVADASYWTQTSGTSHLDAEAPRPRPTPLIPPAGRTPRVSVSRPRPIPARPQELMRDRLASPAGKRRYRQRSTTVEPVFGHIKGNRRFVRFRRRGLDAARAEWRLVTTTHNLLKLWRHTLQISTAS
jgi:transposase